MFTICINFSDVVVGLIIFTFFFNKIKKKGDSGLTLPKLDSLFKIVLVVGRNNNVSIDKKANIHK